MDGPFGAGAVTVLRDPERVDGSADLAAAVAAFSAQTPDTAPVLRFARCRATAAFSRRDTLLPGYAEAVDLVRERGFEPVVRPVGGRLAVYDEGSVVLHCTAGHPDPRLHVTRRFEVFAGLVADVLSDLGVPDVRIGRVPGEYCEGDWSVNAGGRAKLAGTGQRLNRRGYLFSAVLTVTGADRLRAVLVDAYRVLGLDLRPESVGAVQSWYPGIAVAEVEDRLAARFVDLVAPAR